MKQGAVHLGIVAVVGFWGLEAGLLCFAVRIDRFLQSAVTRGAVTGLNTGCIIPGLRPGLYQPQEPSPWQAFYHPVPESSDVGTVNLICLTDSQAFQVAMECFHIGYIALDGFFSFAIR